MAKSKLGNSGTLSYVANCWILASHNLLQITAYSLKVLLRLLQCCWCTWMMSLSLVQVSYFLGLEIAHGIDGTYINQHKYILDILTDTGLLGSKPVAMPLPKGHKFFEKQRSPLIDPNQYRRLIGRFLYLNFTHPDLTFVVQQLSQFVGALNQQHWDTAIHVLRYLKGCPSKGLYFPATNSLQPFAYYDAG